MYLKDVRMAQIPPHQRPFYPAREHMAILAAGIGLASMGPLSKSDK